jgi:hypothetical protein
MLKKKKKTLIFLVEISKLRQSFMTCQARTQSSGYSWYGQNVSMLASYNGLPAILGYYCDNKLIKYLTYIGQTPLQHELDFFRTLCPTQANLKTPFFPLLLILRNCYYHVT